MAGVSLVSTSSRGAGRAWGALLPGLPPQANLPGVINEPLPKTLKAPAWAAAHPIREECGPQESQRRASERRLAGSNFPRTRIRLGLRRGLRAGRGSDQRERRGDTPPGGRGTSRALTPSSAARPGPARPRRQASAAGPRAPAPGGGEAGRQQTRRSRLGGGEAPGGAASEGDDASAPR